MKCRYCPDSILTLKAYKLHHKVKHSLQPYACFLTSCCRKFPEWKSLVAHFKNCNDTNLLVNFANAFDGGNVAPVMDVPDEDIPQTSKSDNNFVQSVGFSDLMQSATDSFVSKLYQKPKLPRSYVQDIIEDVNAYIKDDLLENLKQSLVSKVELNNSQLLALNSVFTDFAEPFVHVATEYVRLKHFKDSGEYIAPIPHEVGEVSVAVATKDGPVLKPQKCYVQSVPIDVVLQKFLELPNALSDILAYMEVLKGDHETKENFVQCKLWEKKLSKFSDEDIVVPLHVYYDDVECNNPLGSRSNKLGAVYVSIPVLPLECQSSIDNIFLALVFESWMRQFSDDVVFEPLISQLKNLENEGIVVNRNGAQTVVYFVMGLMLGDNLGLNSVLGFAECFTANYFCRFCKTLKIDSERQCLENIALLRTEQSYRDDLAIDSVTLTGVKKNSALNQVPSFHVASNYAVDVFHDLCEGVCHYVLLQILRHCVPKYFKVETLNNRIDMFQYGPCDSNRIPHVPLDLTCSKLKMSGAETLLFVKMFGLLIGDLVPRDEFWELYLKLLELLDVCLSKSRSQKSVSLKVIVEEFNEMYVRVTGDSLKPKMHFLVHYATVFEQSGPLYLLSTHRFESKHRSLLIPAHATESRKNIARTVAVAHQLNMCHRLQSRDSILTKTEFGPSCHLSLSDFDHYKEFSTSLPECILSSPIALSHNWINFKGSTFKPGMVILISVSDTGGPIFGIIEAILSSPSTLLLLYSNLVTVGFCDHVHGYQVEMCDSWSCIDILTLFDPLPLSVHRSIYGDKYVILRYAL